MKSGETIGEVPACWAQHIAENEFNCVKVFELLVKRSINPMYGADGHRLFSAGGVFVDSDATIPQHESDALEHESDVSDDDGLNSDDSD